MGGQDERRTWSGEETMTIQQGDSVGREGGKQRDRVTGQQHEKRIIKPHDRRRRRQRTKSQSGGKKGRRDRV